MSKRLLVANMMLSTVLLAASVPMTSASAASSGASETSTVVSSSKANGQSEVNNSSQTTTVKALTTKEQEKNDKIQTLTSQTMILKKIVMTNGTAKSSVGSLNISQDNFKGINGATFKIYDVTDLMNEILKEKLKTNDKVKATGTQIDTAVNNTSIAQSSSSQAQASSNESTSSQSGSSQSISESSATKSTVTSESSSTGNASGQSSNSDTVDKGLEAKVNELMSNDMLRKTVADRAAKLSDKQLKLVSTVKTAHDSKLKSDGVASVKLPIDGKYHAYYVVNTDTPKASYVANADPLVIFTPITSDDGMYANDFTIYTKSDSIPKPKKPNTVPAKVTTAKMYQTGTSESKGWFNKLVNMVWNIF